MALSGTLKDFALPDIFQLIGMQRKTGLLTLESDRETVTVVFEQGMVVHADSTVRRLDDLLGNVLVRQGKIRKEVLEEALSKQKVSMQRLGFILTSQGYISRDDLKGALSEQVQQIVFRVFRWKSGRYHFDPSAETDYDRENVSPVSTDHILMEGIRRVDEWPIIEKRIPSLDFVFRPLVPVKQIRVDEGSKDEAGGLESALGSLDGSGSSNASPTSEVMMGQTEYHIYKLLDGNRSVSILMEMTGLSDFDVCRTLFDFIDRNLVAPAGQGQAKASPESGRRRVTAAPGAGAGIAALAAVLVLVAIGLFVSLSTPFRVPVLPSFFREEAPAILKSRDMARMQRVVAALRTYYLTFGSYPASLDDLANASPPLLVASDVKSASGETFRYRTTNDRVLLEALDSSGDPYLSLAREILPDEVTLSGSPPVRSSSP
jgi:Domain of unknown function (DUF4388)